MAYEKNTWQTGDTITATKLNNMENGIANASVMIVNLTIDWSADTPSATADKTFDEIYSEVANGQYVVAYNLYEEAGETYYYVYALEEIKYSPDPVYGNYATFVYILVEGETGITKQTVTIDKYAGVQISSISYPST